MRNSGSKAGRLVGRFAEFKVNDRASPSCLAINVGNISTF
jgi:hypothetical protein